MDSQISEHLAVGSARRDVQAIRDALVSLKPGAGARVVVRSPRYGLYVVDGTVRTGVGGQPMLADLFLTTGSEIQRIYTPSTLVPYPESPADLTGADLEHGSVVRVTFSDPALGVFQITGPVTAGQDTHLLVGSWIITRAGVVVPRVAHIERIPETPIHPTNVPPLRSVIVEEATA